MERTVEFRRRAFVAAGPVFLVALGALMLLVLGVSALAAPASPALAVAFLVVGGGALGVGLPWGAGKDRASAGEG